MTTLTEQKKSSIIERKCSNCDKPIYNNVADNLRSGDIFYYSCDSKIYCQKCFKKIFPDEKVKYWWNSTKN